MNSYQVFNSILLKIKNYAQSTCPLRQVSFVIRKYTVFISNYIQKTMIVKRKIIIFRKIFLFNI